MKQISKFLKQLSDWFRSLGNLCTQLLLRLMQGVCVVPLFILACIVAIFVAIAKTGSCVVLALGDFVDARDIDDLFDKTFKC